MVMIRANVHVGCVYKYRSKARQHMQVNSKLIQSHKMILSVNSSMAVGLNILLKWTLWDHVRECQKCLSACLSMLSRPKPTKFAKWLAYIGGACKKSHESKFVERPWVSIFLFCMLSFPKPLDKFHQIYCVTYSGGEVKSVLTNK